MMLDGHKVDRYSAALQQNARTTNCQFADPAFAKAATHHDALGLDPALGPQEPADHTCQFRREFFDRAVQQSGRFGIALEQQLVELALGNVGNGFVAQRIVGNLAQPLAPILNDFREGAAAGAVADEATLAVAHLEIVTVDHHGRQLGRSVDDSLL